MKTTNEFKKLLHESIKSDDTEEWIDIYFTRPVGLLFAIIWKKLGVKPNSITILSIILGIAAGIMFYFRDITHNIIGIILLILANLCDSTDGQLARLTNQKTVIGRCLDGLAGNIWFITIYIAIICRIWFQHIPFTTEVWGIFGLLIAAVAGIVSHTEQSSLSDYYRQIHLLMLKGKKHSELDTYRDEHQKVKKLRKSKNNFIELLFHTNYQYYCKSQERRTPEFQKLKSTINKEFNDVDNIPEKYKKEFLKESKKLMPLTNFLTFNSRAIIIYITCIADIPWLYLIIEISIYNIIYIYMHKKHEELCKNINRQIISQTDKKINKAYIFDFGGTIDTNGYHWAKKIYLTFSQFGININEDDFKHAYIQTEKKLTEEKLIKSDDSLYTTIEKKITLQFKFLSQKNIVDLSNIQIEKIINQLYNDVKNTIAQSKQILTKLKQNNKIAVVSNFYGNLETVLKEFEINKLFDTIIDSTIVGFRKPNPQIFKIAIEQLRIDPKQITVVGDSYNNDIIPSHSLGMKTIWLNNATWDNNDNNTNITNKTIKSLTEILQ